MSEQHSVSRMTSALTAMRSLLAHHDSEWTKSVGEILHDWLGARTPEERSLVARRLSRIHGNLGLSDEYFEKDGQILQEETRKLSALRDEVYELVPYFVR